MESNMTDIFDPSFKNIAVKISGVGGSDPAAKTLKVEPLGKE
jgi:hypothetical protein